MSIFYFIAFLSILFAVLVISAKNPVHSILYLILTFFTFTIQYVLLNAQFLAIVNFIVYMGALLVLVVASLKAVGISQPVLLSDPGLGLVKNLGKVLFNEFLLPFEVSSLLLLSAMVGAVLLATKETKSV